jgi:hypothetical protein
VQSSRGGGRLRRVLIAATLLVGAAALSACGGDDDGDTSGQAAFRSDFARISASYQQRTDALKDQSRQAVGQGLDRVLPVYESMLEAVAAAHDEYASLDPPEALEKDVEQLVDVLDRQEKVLRQVVEQARTGKSSELGGSLQELTTLLLDFSKTYQQVEKELG